MTPFKNPTTGSTVVSLISRCNIVFSPRFNQILIVKNILVTEICLFIVENYDATSVFSDFYLREKHRNIELTSHLTKGGNITHEPMHCKSDNQRTTISSH